MTKRRRTTGQYNDQNQKEDRQYNDQKKRQGQIQ